MVQNLPSDSLPSDAISGGKQTSQFVGFEIDGQQYAFRIEQIQEIVMPDQVTETPQVADYVEGVRNLRGEIIPIINLRKLLGLPSKQADSDTRTIVVNVGQRTMGCTVDAVSHVIRIPEQSIQPVPETMTVAGSHDIAGFAKVDANLVIILDIEELLSPERLKRHPVREVNPS
ncbi:Chemotaxis protein CheW [Roseimaritima multifibrata]|uniref:Chemotaxis protein CheW n=1 Tax=Roseimaritima multifibrata TaxID=1930274 RepID=A0A517MI81_9BACT|nr:chemotaxis protein CheW [Roseimaritima multifibrata]QDS94592.1 Chemotaxis protein CheW [Roseimaritima multifibrata]